MLGLKFHQFTIGWSLNQQKYEIINLSDTVDGSEIRQVKNSWGKGGLILLLTWVLAPSQVVDLGIYEPSKCFIIFLKSRNLREHKSSYLAILRTWPFLAMVKTWPELKGRWCPPTIGDQKVTNWITWWWVFPSLDLLKMLADARNKF